MIKHGCMLVHDQTHRPTENNLSVMYTKPYNIPEKDSYFNSSLEDAQKGIEMSFAIQTLHIDDMTTERGLIDYIEELPIETIEDNGFDIHRLSAKIAKDTRRGMGNVILYNSLRLPKIGRLFSLIPFHAMSEDEYVMMYRGHNEFDGPFFEKAQYGKVHFYAHKDWQKYCKRFKLK